MLLMATSCTNLPLVTAVLVYLATFMLTAESFIVSSSKERVRHMGGFLENPKDGTDYFMPGFSPCLPDSYA